MLFGLDPGDPSDSRGQRNPTSRLHSPRAGPPWYNRNWVVGSISLMPARCRGLSVRCLATWTLPPHVRHFTVDAFRGSRLALETPAVCDALVRIARTSSRCKCLITSSVLPSDAVEICSFVNRAVRQHGSSSADECFAGLPSNTMKRETSRADRRWGGAQAGKNTAASHPLGNRRLSQPPIRLRVSWYRRLGGPASDPATSVRSAAARIAAPRVDDSMCQSALTLSGRRLHDRC